MTDQVNYPLNKVESIWVGTTNKTNYPTLEEELEADVVIVGTGITGLSTALRLSEAGLKIILLDNAQIILGTTGYTTAKLTSQHGLIYKRIADKHGLEASQVYADANQWAIKEVQNISKKYQIDCDLLEKPAFTYTTSEEGLDQIQAEVEICKKLGLPASVVSEDLGLPFKTKGSIKYDNQYQFHPRKYLLPLAETLNKKGHPIFADSAVEEVDQENLTVKTKNGQVKSKFIVLATKTPIIDVETWQRKQEKKMSFVVCGPSKSELPNGVFYPLEKNFYSLRTQLTEQGEYLLYGGQDVWTEDDVKKEEIEKIFEDMAKKAEEVFGLDEIAYYWLASDHMSKDSLPFIGRAKPDSNIFIATGYSGWGMTTGVYAAKIISDEILGNKNEWSGAFLPYRTI
jgi:glycine/D-amino acid oxidase-like deaminating enzyme